MSRVDGVAGVRVVVAPNAAAARAFFLRSRHAAIVTVTQPANESLHCAHTVKTAVFFYFFFSPNFSYFNGYSCLRFRFSRPFRFPTPRHVVKCFQVPVRCRVRRLPSFVSTVAIFFMEANESNEVRSTGTPPANGSGGSNCRSGSSRTSAEPLSGSKILSKNSNGTSE